MSLLEDMRQRIQRQGASREGIFFIKKGEKKRIRFLVDLDKGLKVVFHDKFGEINVPCRSHFGANCPHCENEELRTRDNFAWPIYNYDDKRVQIFMFKANENTPVPHLLALFEEFETLLDRDIIIGRQGERFDTVYSVIPMDKKRFSLGDKVKALKRAAMLDMLDKAFPDSSKDLDLDDDDDEDYEEETPAPKAKKGKVEPPKKKRKVEEEEEDEEEEDEEEEEEEPAPKKRRR